MIWAEARDGVIGFDGDMPWQLPEDLAHFKALTVGHPVIMGRRTWESIPERFRPLVGRRNIVVTRQAGFAAEGAEVAGSVEEAIALAGEGTAWIIGGASVYSAALGLADRLEVTEINLSVEGDTHGPPVGAEFSVVSREPETGWHVSSTGIEYRFVAYERGTL